MPCLLPFLDWLLDLGQSGPLVSVSGESEPRAWPPDVLLVLTGSAGLLVLFIFTTDFHIQPIVVLMKAVQFAGKTVTYK